MSRALESIYKELVKSTTKHDSTMRICAPSFFFRILGTFFFFPMTLLATKETHILSFTLFIPSLDFPCLVLPFFFFILKKHEEPLTSLWAPLWSLKIPSTIWSSLINFDKFNILFIGWLGLITLRNPIRSLRSWWSWSHHQFWLQRSSPLKLFDHMNNVILMGVPYVNSVFIIVLRLAWPVDLPLSLKISCRLKRIS